MDRAQLLERIESRWRELNQSYQDLPDSELLRPGVVGEWSVKDVLAHVTTWEEEALKALPRIMEGLRAKRYNGIDQFNARQAALKKDLTLKEVLEQSVHTHQRLMAFLATVPKTHFASETRFRRRLRLDTYGHYPEHAASIREWRTPCKR